MKHSLDQLPFLGLWNWIVLSGAILALFFLFTNGIPLIQWGLFPELGGKTRYVNMMRIVVSAFFSLMLFVNWKCPNVFDQLWVVRIARSILRAPFLIILLIISSVYSAVLATSCILRHMGLQSQAYDLGIFAQVVWNTLQGDLLYSSIKGGISYLGDHVSPVLVLLAPLYALWPHPETLLILQAVATGSCIFLIGLIAREKFQNNFIGVIFALMYFFNFIARRILHAEFHPEILVEPFMLLAFIFLEKRRVLWFLLSLAVVVSAKENMLGISFMMGFYAFAFKKLKILGIFTMLFSMCLFFIELKWIVPHFSGKIHQYSDYYHYLYSESPIQGLFAILFKKSSLIYIFKIYSVFLFLPFFYFPTLLLTFPVLFQNLLSTAPSMRELAFHYAAGLTPLAFVASIFGFYSLLQKFPWLLKHKTMISCLLFWGMLLRSGPSEYFYCWNYSKLNTSHNAMIREKLHAIPSQFSVMTQGHLVPHAVNRKYIYDSENFDWVAIKRLAQRYDIDYVIFDQAFWKDYEPSIPDTLKAWQSFGFFIEFEKDGFYILRKTQDVVGSKS